MTLRIKVFDEDGFEKYYEFEKDNIVIGRIEPADIPLKHKRISRKHAVLSKEDDLYIIGDLGSSNGTFVNDHRISSRYRLSPDDSIRIGPYTLKVEQTSEEKLVSIDNKINTKNPQTQLQIPKKFCQNCGTEITQKDKFCSNCGKNLTT